MAITERLTLLAVQKSRDPAMIVPTLERPDAEQAPGAGTLELIDWVDGSDPHSIFAAFLDPAGAYAISDSAWALQLLGLQQALPGMRCVSMTSALPMLRAVKDADELERLAADARSSQMSLLAIFRRFAVSLALARRGPSVRCHGCQTEQLDGRVVGKCPVLDD